MKQNAKCAMAAILVTAFCRPAGAEGPIGMREGSEIAPGSCAITVNGTTEYKIDYGEIARASLSPTAAMPLPIRTAALSITCSASTKVAIRSRDGRHGSNPLSDHDLRPTNQGKGGSGLGWSNGRPVGAYAVHILPGLTVDGARADPIWRAGSGDQWRKADGAVALNVEPDGVASVPLVEASWARPGENVPAAGKIFTGTIAIQAMVDRTTRLGAADAVVLDGQSAIELVYP